MSAGGLHLQHFGHLIWVPQAAALPVRWRRRRHRARRRTRCVRCALHHMRCAVPQQVHAREQKRNQPTRCIPREARVPHRRRLLSMAIALHRLLHRLHGAPAHAMTRLAPLRAIRIPAMPSSSRPSPTMPCRPCRPCRLYRPLEGAVGPSKGAVVVLFFFSIFGDFSNERMMSKNGKITQKTH